VNARVQHPKLRVEACITLRGVDLVATAEVEEGEVDLDTLELVTDEPTPRPFYTRGREEEDIEVALVDEYWEAVVEASKRGHVSDCLRCGGLRGDLCAHEFGSAA
jgi:hypothetical protein